MRLVTAEQMRTLDRRTIEETGIPGVVLMENAGRTAFQIIHEIFSPFCGKKVLIFAGRGNNGGDGFVLARYFLEAGAFVEVLLLSTMDKVGGDARINLEICRNMGIPIQEVTSEEDLSPAQERWSQAYLLVDALLGTGLNSEVRGLFATAIELMNHLPTPVVSVDIPSGLDSDRGVMLGTAVQADLTVTFGFPKIGHAVYPGRGLTGTLACVDISIPGSLLKTERIRSRLLTREELTFPAERSPDAHKGHFGHLLALAGSPGKTGAGALLAGAAARAGTGLVTLGVPKSLNPVLEAKLTEAMTLPLPETEDGVLCKESLEAMEASLPGKTALAVGPGVSTRPETAECVCELIRRSSIPMVLDADALTAIADRPDVLLESKVPLILTPHPGEMSRLTGKSPREIQTDRTAVAASFAEKFGVHLVLKGARTVIALPDGEIFVNVTGNPGLASGGTGDVLTGLIGGFLAQGMAPEEAAKLGVYLHGLAADMCAEEIGSIGFLAGDLCNRIPDAIARLMGDEEEAEFPIPLAVLVP